jgi:hypothetical protein
MVCERGYIAKINVQADDTVAVPRTGGEGVLRMSYARQGAARG